jgi:hypothetical protein
LNRLGVVAAAAVVALLLPAQAAQAAVTNHRPTVPSSLAVSGVACGDKGIFIGTTMPEFFAVLDDPDFGVDAYERSSRSSRCGRSVRATSGSSGRRRGSPAKVWPGRTRPRL